MAFSSSSCFFSLPLTSLQFKQQQQLIGGGGGGRVGTDQSLTSALKSKNAELFGQQVAAIGTDIRRDWIFLGGSIVILRNPQVAAFIHNQKAFGVHASWIVGSQIASNVFTIGTAAVLPFYTLMVVAPKADLTKKSVKCSIPSVVLGLLYAYLLVLSWTPDTLRLMFASKYWLPELPGMVKMFSIEMTLASTWIQLLAVDLFAARQVYHDGLENQIETRHSVSAPH